MHELISELVHVAPSDTPFLSLYMDTRPGDARRAQGRRQRPALVWLKRRLSEVAAAMPVRGKARQSLQRDTERIHAFLEAELSPSTQGLALFASHGRDFFVAHQFRVPLDNELIVDEVPHVYPLARLLDGHRACAAVLADSESARVYTMALGRTVQAAYVHHPLERPEKPSSGGGVGAFGATRLTFQRYLEGQVQHHLKGVVEQLDRIVTQERLAHIVVGGSESVAAELIRLLPKHLQDKVVERLHLDPDAPEDEVMHATMRILEARLGQDRARKVEWLCKEDLAEGLGVLGVARTLRALNEGNVDEIVFASAFSVGGAVCAACDQLLDYAAEDGTCRYCGGALKPIADLREAIAFRAERLGARIDVVDRHPVLKGSGGVGAILRYRSAIHPS